MLMLNDASAKFDASAASAARTVKVAVTAAAGVPDNVPVAPFSDSPSGSAPETMLHANVPEPPVALSDAV